MSHIAGCCGRKSVGRSDRTRDFQRNLSPLWGNAWETFEKVGKQMCVCGNCGQWRWDKAKSRSTRCFAAERYKVGEGVPVRIGLRNWDEDWCNASIMVVVLVCTEILLKLRRGDAWHFVHDLLLILNNAEFAFIVFREMLKTWEYFARLAPKEMEKDKMSLWFTQKVLLWITVEKVVVHCWTRKMYLNFYLVTNNDGRAWKIIFHNCDSGSSNGYRERYNAVHFDGFEYVQRLGVNEVMFSKKLKRGWIGESNGAPSAIPLVQSYVEKQPVRQNVERWS